MLLDWFHSVFNSWPARFRVTRSTNSQEPETAAPARAVPGPHQVPELCIRREAVTPKHVEDRQWRNSYPISRVRSDTIQTIVPFTISFAPKELPAGWERCVTPEGKVYFRHHHRCDEAHSMSACSLHALCYERHMTILTNNDMYRDDELASIETQIREILSSDSSTSIPIGAELVVDLDREIYRCGYYFVSESTKSIFWDKAMSAPQVAFNWDQPIISFAHLGLAVEALFCHHPRIALHLIMATCRTHVQMFPVHRKITDELVKDIRNLLCTAYSDVLTSSTSTVPYQQEEISAFLSIVDKVKVDSSDESGHGFWAIARPMFALKYKMFENYYGESHARLNQDQSVFDSEVVSRAPLLRIFSAFLFWMPDQCMVRLEKIWIDDMLCFVRWHEFIADMKREWEKTITPATVLLSANVGFLAIQSIDNGHDNTKSVAQVASYASTILSLGCYIIGHILSLQHSHERRKGEKQAADVDYLRRTQELHIRLEHLAFAYSLPSGLFMWSMLAFLVAMTWVFFDGTDNGTKSFLAALLSCLFFITSAVLVMEGATSGAPGTVRHRISVLIVKMCTIRPARWKRQMDWCFDTLSSVFRRVRNPTTGAAAHA